MSKYRRVEFPPLIFDGLKVAESLIWPNPGMNRFPPACLSGGSYRRISARTRILMGAGGFPRNVRNSLAALKSAPRGPKGPYWAPRGVRTFWGGFPQYPYIPHPIGVRGVESPISRCSSAVITQILYMKAPGQNLGSAKIVTQ